MHGPGAPSVLPPQEDTIYVHGGPGPGESGRWSHSRAPGGRRPERPRASQRARLPSGGQTRPKAPEQRLGTHGGTGTGRGEAPTAGDAPGAVLKLPECPPINPSRVGKGGPPETLTERRTTRPEKGHCVPGLGSAGTLMDPNLGATPRGWGLKSPASVAGGALSLPPPTGEGMTCRWWAPSRGRLGTRLGVGDGVTGDPETEPEESYTLRPSGHPGNRISGKGRWCRVSWEREEASQRWEDFLCPSSRPPP